MDMYEGGDGQITDIHEGRFRVAKLTLMGIYEGGSRRAYPDGLTFEVVTETTTVFCRVRRELENSACLWEPAIWEVFRWASSSREDIQMREIRYKGLSTRHQVLVDETRGGRF